MNLNVLHGAPPYLMNLRVLLDEHLRDDLCILRAEPLRSTGCVLLDEPPRDALSSCDFVPRN